MRGAALLVACWALVGTAFAGETSRSVAPATQAVLARIEARMAEVRTIRARFRQAKRMPLFAKEIVLEGEIGLGKPDRFLWRVERPVPYCLVMDESGFRQWDAETRRVQRGRLEGNPVLRVVVEQLTGFFSGRFLAMTHEFEIALKQADPVELVGTVRPGSPAAAGIRSFVVRFGADERYVSSVSVVESEGGETRIEFRDVELNVPLGPDFWQVSPRGR
jgi:outer membrane lipoprotein-sorting protein